MGLIFDSCDIRKYAQVLMTPCYLVQFSKLTQADGFPIYT